MAGPEGLSGGGEPGGRNGHLPMRVPIATESDIVVARQHGRALATDMNFSSTESAFIATTVSELARALLAHTARGEIWLNRVDEQGRSGVVIVARDPVARVGAVAGPLSLAGLELPELYRLVDEFDVASEANRGTTIRATKWRRW